MSTGVFNLAFLVLGLCTVLLGTSVGWRISVLRCRKATRAHNDMHITAQTLIAEMRTQICTQHSEIERLREESKKPRIMSQLAKPTLVTSRITGENMKKIRDDNRRLATMQPTDPALVALTDGTVYRWDSRQQCWNLT